jgi:hypothetical protein
MLNASPRQAGRGAPEDLQTLRALCPWIAFAVLSPFGPDIAANPWPSSSKSTLRPAISAIDRPRAGICRIGLPNAVAQTRMVSGCDIQLNRRKPARLFKRVLWDDISEFESDLPSQAVAGETCYSSTPSLRSSE